MGSSSNTFSSWAAERVTVSPKPAAGVVWCRTVAFVGDQPSIPYMIIPTVLACTPCIFFEGPPPPEHVNLFHLHRSEN